MGVLIGDEPVFNHSSFVDAVCEELLDRAKGKFYESYFLFLQRLQRKTASRTEIHHQPAKEIVAAGRFLLDARIYYRAVFTRIFSLGQIKKPVNHHRLSY